MSESPLSKHAGPIALVAGGLFAVTHVGQFLTWTTPATSLRWCRPAFQVFTSAYSITFPYC